MMTVEAFRKSRLCSEVHNILVSHLMQVLGDDYDTVPLAVRSSASGITFTDSHLLQCLAACYLGYFVNHVTETHPFSFVFLLPMLFFDLFFTVKPLKLFIHSLRTFY